MQSMPSAGGADPKVGEQAQMVALDKIHVDNSVQARARVEPKLVDQYVEAMEEGAIFPPLTIFNDGEKNILADGFHRYQAAQRIGQSPFPCNVITGGLRDATLFAAGANATHGRHRTHEDKRCSVRKLLDDVEWCGWADRDIARHCHVSHQLVGKLRSLTGRETSEVKYSKSGNIRTMKTGNIGKSQNGKTEIPASPVGPDQIGTDKNVDRDEALAVLGAFAKFAIARISRLDETVCITVAPEDVEDFERLLERVRLVLDVTDDALEG